MTTDDNRRNRSARKHVVGIADMMVSADPAAEIITYSLGSCLGITVYDPVRQVGGLLHVMLPTAANVLHAGQAASNPLMYVDTGVPKFLNALLRQGADKGRLEIKVCGGAHLQFLIDADPGFRVGEHNYQAFRRLLSQNGLNLKAEDVGGDHPRTMSLAIDSGDVFIRGNGVVMPL